MIMQLIFRIQMELVTISLPRDPFLGSAIRWRVEELPQHDEPSRFPVPRNLHQCEFRITWCVQHLNEGSFTYSSSTVRKQI
jgi:hypothetical protein